MTPGTFLALGSHGLTNSFQWKSQSNKQFSVNPSLFLMFLLCLNGFFSALTFSSLVPFYLACTLLGLRDTRLQAAVF